MRFAMVVVLWMSIGLIGPSVQPAAAQVSVGIGLPNVSIGINVPTYPQLVQVPGYPVYYAPSLPANYFFYDGMYWVYSGDSWYASTWYNGPWSVVAPAAVPVYVLRVPVGYYRAPPVYFHGWAYNAPPRWGDHWGYAWAQNHVGWDHWNRTAVPVLAPLPVYQRQYYGDRYPHAEQQYALRNEHYRYQPRDTVVREHYQQQALARPAAAPQSAGPGAPRGPEGNRGAPPSQFSRGGSPQQMQQQGQGSSSQFGGRSREAQQGRPPQAQMQQQGAPQQMTRQAQPPGAPQQMARQGQPPGAPPHAQGQPQGQPQMTRQAQPQGNPQHGQGGGHQQEHGKGGGGQEQNR
jgi:hypothetical protein